MGAKYKKKSLNECNAKMDIEEDGIGITFIVFPAKKIELGDVH